MAANVTEAVTLVKTQPKRAAAVCFVSAMLLLEYLVVYSVQCQILFTSVGYDRLGMLFRYPGLYAVNEDGSGLRRLPAYVGHPRGSPRGDWILGTKGASDVNIDIYIIRPDGSLTHNLTNHPAMDMNPTWSPDGRQIAFASNRIREVEPRDIFIMDADGSNVRHLVYGWQPAWSPDGRRIAFASNVDPGAVGIYVVDVDGRNRKRLTNPGNPRGWDTDRTPAWAPDSQRIAFERHGAIAVMNADGTDLRFLTDEWGSLHPTWSPDGKQIAFQRVLGVGEGAQSDIFVMNVDGANQRNITNDPADDMWPSWCPVPLVTAVSPAGKTPLVWAQLKRAP